MATRSKEGGVNTLLDSWGNLNPGNLENWRQGSMIRSVTRTTPRFLLEANDRSPTNNMNWTKHEMSCNKAI